MGFLRIDLRSFAKSFTARDWAIGAGIKATPFPAKWSTYGNAAGPIRNQEMVDTKPDIVVAFPGGTGTADAVRRARSAGIEVLEIK